MTISGDEPAAWCRPSTFCVTSVWTLGLLLELGERDVAGVGLTREQLAAGAVAPHVAAMVGILHVVLDVGLALGRGVLGPDALRPAEVGDARLGGDPRAGEHHDLVGDAKQCGEAIQLLGVGHDPTLRERTSERDATRGAKSTSGAPRGTTRRAARHAAASTGASSNRDLAVAGYEAMPPRWTPVTWSSASR